MLFSRSGVNFNNKISSRNYENFALESIVVKFMGIKPNSAIFPQIIYDSPSVIEFSREELIKILKTENEIRLSDEKKSLYDANGSFRP